MREAGIPIRTGTVAVEAFWSQLKDMLPRGARRVSLRWFRVLSKICFLRYNYRLFNDRRSAPPWTEGGALVAEEVGHLALLVQAASERNTAQTTHLEPLFHAFDK